jgi:PAS domain S-box-containing protein
LYSAGILIYKIDLFSYATNKYIWISDGLNLLLTSLGLLYIGMNYHGEIIDNYIQIDKQNKNLVDKEKKFRILFESSHDAIILIDNSKFFDCNKITFSLFKCEREFIIGKEPHEFSPEFQPDGQNSLEKANFLFSEVYKGNHQIFEWQHVRPNGELFDVSISLNLVDLGDKKYAQAVLRDITEKKKQEKELIDYKLHLERLVRARTLDLETTNEELLATNEELFLKNEKISEQKEELEITLQQLKDAQTHLLQSEKMASLGILTAGVAHEINNPLNFIMGGYVGLEKHFAENNQLDDPKIIQILNSIKTGVNRATNIVNSLNQFSRSRNTLDEICNIQEIIDNCLLMLNNQLKNRIEVIKDYKLQLPYIKGNVGKLHQVFVNILTNVSQSISGKGFITIKTTTLENTAIIEVIDSGCGISQENLNKITDPFFTTKEPGKGTGLGLSITYAIIQEHKGKLHFISELDKGTTVKITFPLN